MRKLFRRSGRNPGVLTIIGADKHLTRRGGQCLHATLDRAESGRQNARTDWAHGRQGQHAQSAGDLLASTLVGRAHCSRSACECASQPCRAYLRADAPLLGPSSPTHKLRLHSTPIFPPVSAFYHHVRCLHSKTPLREESIEQQSLLTYPPKYRQRNGAG